MELMRSFVGLFSLILLLAGCKPAPVFLSTDITGAAIGGPFALTDHTGKPRSLDDFKGKVVVLFFGFTHCPDACPTTLAELAGAMKTLGPAAKDVQVLFITVDPARDSQALLAQYVPAFHPSFIGLYGSEAQTRLVADRYKIFYQKTPGADEKNYAVDHTSGSYIIDQQGALRLLVKYGAGAATFKHDIEMLLNR